MAITLHGRGVSLQAVEETPDNRIDVSYNGVTICSITSAGISGLEYNSTTNGGSGVFGTTTITANRWLNVNIGGTTYYVPAVASAAASA